MRPYDLRPARRAARWWAALAFGALIGPASAYNAADYPIRSEFGANQSLNTATKYTSAWTASADGVSGVKVGANFTMKAPGGRAVNAAILNTMSRSQAARILARGMASGGWLGAGLAAYSIYDAVRVREPENGEEGLKHDPGVNPTTQSVYVFCTIDCSSPGRFATEAEAAQWQLANSLVPGTTSGYRNVNGTQTLITCNHAYTYVGLLNAWTGAQNTMRFQQTGTVYNFTVNCQAVAPGTYIDRGITRTQVQQQRCAGGAVPDYDGKCPTGTYTTDISVEEAVSRRNLADSQMPSSAPQLSALAAALNDMWGRTPVNIEELDAAPLVQDVPNVAGGTSKITNPDGSSVQTAIAWDFKPYGLTKGFGYADSGAWDEKTTTTTCAGGGTQCTTTETTTENDPQGEGEQGDPEDPCTANPERAGCLGLGELPTDEVPRTSLALAYSTETISLPSGCPPDVALPRGQTFSYATACEAATLARPLVIAAAAMTALWICVAAVGGTRGSA